MPLTSRLLVGLLGAALVTAAILKAMGSSNAPTLAPFAWIARGEAKAVLVAAEIALGLWFISGVGLRAARWAAVVAFAAFSIASGSAVLVGAPSCDCLGPAPVSPAAILAFDLVAVFLLLLARFNAPWELADRLAARIAIGAAAISAVVLTLASFWLDTSTRADGPLSIEPVVATVGECRPGEPTSTDITFTNRTDEPIQIIVAQSDCSCIIADVPAWIAPRQSRRVRVEVRPPQEPGEFVRKIGWLTTAGPRSGELRGVVVSRP